MSFNHFHFMLQERHSFLRRHVAAPATVRCTSMYVSSVDLLAFLPQTTSYNNLQTDYMQIVIFLLCQRNQINKYIHVLSNIKTLQPPTAPGKSKASPKKDKKGKGKAASDVDDPQVLGIAVFYCVSPFRLSISLIFLFDEM